MGKMKLSQIKPIHITEFFTSIKKYSHSLRRKIKFILNSAFECAIYIMLNTGMRNGEVRALTADKIDFKKGFIKIGTAVKSTEELGVPKNGKTRYVPIESNVVKFLKTKVSENTTFVIGNIVSGIHTGHCGKRTVCRLRWLRKS